MFHSYLMASHGFGEPMNCILQPQNGRGGLYLGNIESAGNGKLLGHHDIGAILASMSTKDYTYDAHISHKFIRVDDADFVNLSKYFDEAIDFIDSNRLHTNVLVHCHAGVSRSASLVIAYLMKTQNMSLDQAFKHVQTQRRIVNPNPGFMRQLKQYEAKLQGSNSLRQSQVRSRERQHSSSNNLRQSQYAERVYPPENYNQLYQNYQPHRQYQSTNDLMRQSQANYERLNTRQMPQQQQQYPFMTQHYTPYVRNYSVPYSPFHFTQYRQGCY